MKILVTASKGGVGCSSIAYLLGMMLPERNMYSNDSWHVPDPSILPLNNVSQFSTLNLEANSHYIFDISMAREGLLTNEIAKIVDVILIPCSNDLKSAEAALSVYKSLVGRCVNCVIVINGYRSEKILIGIHNYLTNNLIAPNCIVELRDSRLMDRIFTYGPEWVESVRHGKGMHRLNNTLAIFTTVLAGAIGL